jgi:DNA polymerase-4
MMENLLGKNGIELWRRAHALDDTPILPYHEQKSLSKEHTFSSDSIHIHFMYGELVRMTEALAFALRKQNKLTGCVTVKVRYANFDTETQQRSIDYTNADHILITTTRELFDKLYNRRLRVRLLGIRFTHMVPGNYQIKLYEDTQEMIRLYQAIDGVKRRYGAQYVMRAVGMNPAGQ